METVQCRMWKVPKSSVNDLPVQAWWCSVAQWETYWVLLTGNAIVQWKHICFVSRMSQIQSSTSLGRTEEKHFRAWNVGEYHQHQERQNNGMSWCKASVHLFGPVSLREDAVFCVQTTGPKMQGRRVGEAGSKLYLDPWSKRRPKSQWRGHNYFLGSYIIKFHENRM